MSTRATASFDVTGWDESPYDEPADGPRLARATVTKMFRGDLEAESTAEVLMCQRDPSDLNAGGGYIASERVAVAVGHRRAVVVAEELGPLEEAARGDALDDSVGADALAQPRLLRGGRIARSSSPSNESTVSTRCSSTLGPAIAPSLVTWHCRQ